MEGIFRVIASRVVLYLWRHRWSFILHGYLVLTPLMRYDRRQPLRGKIPFQVRYTLACSFHEMARIMGQEITSADLLPIFDGFLKDLDEVRIGILKHLADFFELLLPKERRTVSRCGFMGCP